MSETRPMTAGRTAVSVYVDAAEKWASAKERREQAMHESQRASEAAAQADADEHAAWVELQEAAGRGEVRKLADVAAPYRPLPGLR